MLRIKSREQDECSLASPDLSIRVWSKSKGLAIWPRWTRMSACECCSKTKIMRGSYMSDKANDHVVIRERLGDIDLEYNSVRCTYNYYA